MNRIKELRQSKGLTQAELAQKVGVSNQAIHYYENDKREPKMETWQKLADYFGVSVPYLQGLPEPVGKNRLKELRQKKNLTLKRLGKHVGMLDSTLSQYETGKREPGQEVWQKLAYYFGVSVSYIRGDLDTEMLTKIINTMYLIICNRIPMSSERETIDNTEDSRTIVATELMLLMYQVLNLDHNKQFEEIVGKNANLLGIKGKAKLDYIRESSISATNENYQIDIENAKAWIKFYENL